LRTSWLIVGMQAQGIVDRIREERIRFGPKRRDPRGRFGLGQYEGQEILETTGGRSRLGTLPSRRTV
jgi:hypothetical protein